MPNDSSTGGPLSPSSTPPQTDASLDAILQKLIVGLTGLPGSLVRPRWQPTVPKQPEASVDWAAIGVTKINQIGYGPSVEDVDDVTALVRHERIEVMASFYGPNAQQYATITRDGLWLGQNEEPLDTVDMSFVDTGDLQAVPEFLNQTWVHRYDLTIEFNRKVSRAYPILTILSADVLLTCTDPSLTETIEISQ